MRYAILDHHEADQVAAYEKSFYRTFHPIAGPLIQQLWHWDHAEKRLRTAVPYDDQIVYIVMNNQGNVLGGLAVNTKLKNFQSAAYGFQIPGGKEESCELLAFFVAGQHQHGTRFHRSFFRNFCCNDLLARGYRTSYGTSNPKLIPVYVRCGAKVMEEKQIGDEMRYFFEIPLASG